MTSKCKNCGRLREEHNTYDMCPQVLVVWLAGKPRNTAEIDTPKPTTWWEVTDD